MAKGGSKHNATTPSAAPQTSLDNVLGTPSEAEAWIQMKGLVFRLPKNDESVPRLILRTIRYQDDERADGVDSDSFVTAALLTEPAQRFIDNITPLRMDSHSSFDLTTSSTKKKELGGGPGIGRYATREINNGELVIAEKPSVLLPTCIGLGGLQISPSELFISLFERLAKAPGKTKKTQAENVGKLKNLKTSSCSCPEEGIVRTNGIQVDIGGESYSAVFFRIARINHSYAWSYSPVDHPC
jgi:hypothetical protein